MQTQLKPRRDDQEDDTSKILAFVIGAFLLLAAIWALTSLFNSERAALGTGVAVERTGTPGTTGGATR